MKGDPLVPRPRLYVSPGWLGVRALGRYWVLRDVRRHRLLFSERNRIKCRRILRVGPWQVWRKP